MNNSIVGARPTANEPIRDESGRIIAPPQNDYSPRPAGPWDRNQVSR